VLYTDDWFPKLFSFKDLKPYNEKFEKMNLETMILIMNMGTLFVIFAVGVLQYLLFGIAKLTTLCCSWLDNYVKKNTKNYFWSKPIEFLGPSYIEIAFAVLLNF